MEKKIIKLDRLKRSLEHTKKKAEVMKDVEAATLKVYDNKTLKSYMWICSEELIEVINEYLNDKVVRLENEIFKLECEIDEGGVVITLEEILERELNREWTEEDYKRARELIEKCSDVDYSLPDGFELILPTDEGGEDF